MHSTNKLKKRNSKEDTKRRFSNGLQPFAQKKQIEGERQQRGHEEEIFQRPVTICTAQTEGNEETERQTEKGSELRRQKRYEQREDVRDRKTERVPCVQTTESKGKHAARVRT